MRNLIPLLVSKFSKIFSALIHVGLNSRNHFCTESLPFANSSILFKRNSVKIPIDSMKQHIDGNELFTGFRFPIQKLFSQNFLDDPRELDEKIERGLAFKSGTEGIASNMKKKERNLSLAIILIVLIIFCITCVPIAILITLLAIFI